MSSQTESTQVENESTQEPMTPTQTTVDPAAIAQMSPTDILALLERRRQETNQLVQVAKERGIEIPKKSKPKVEDKDRLDDFVLGVGYAIGMRHWAQGRLNANLQRVIGVRTLLGEGWEERAAELVDTLGAGYIKAKLQTSFKSAVMPDKKVAAAAKPADVMSEFLSRLSAEELGDLRELFAGFLDMEVAESDDDGEEEGEEEGK